MLEGGGGYAVLLFVTRGRAATQDRARKHACRQSECRVHLSFLEMNDDRQTRDDSTSCPRCETRKPLSLCSERCLPQGQSRNADDKIELKMRYLRVCLGNESGDPGMTLYEVDNSGWVHRQVQLSAEGTRFAPEDILMCSPVNTSAMVDHPATEEIGVEEFELLWHELSESRSFLSRIPDPTLPWSGYLEHGRRRYAVRWLPAQRAPQGWSRIPGFGCLFVEGGPTEARSACAAVFVDRPLSWVAPAMAA